MSPGFKGQRWGRCRVNRRAERVSRPARAKTRRLRVLVVYDHAHPGRSAAVQRQVVGHRLYRSARRRWRRSGPRGDLQPDAVEVAYRVLGRAAMIGLQFSGSSVPVGVRSRIAGWRLEPVGNRASASPADDEPYRRGVRLGLERGVESSRRHRRRRPSSREWESSPLLVSPRSGPAGWRAGEW